MTRIRSTKVLKRREVRAEETPLRIIIEVNGGNVQEVYASDRNRVKVSVLDWDNVKVDETLDKEARALAKEAEGLDSVGF